MSDYPMLISNKLHSFRNFHMQSYELKRIHNDLNAAEIKLCTVRKPVFQAIRSQVSDPLFSPLKSHCFSAL